MATNQDVFAEIQHIKAAILDKGGSITQVNQNVSLPELVAGVNSIPSGGGGYAIVAAELPGVTLSLYNENGTLASSASGGSRVEFFVSTAGNYTLKALSGQTELWARTMTLDEIGVYNFKSGKALNDYSWDDIATASQNGYAKYMWSVGDTKDLSSYMGQSSATYTRAVILGFDHDDLSNGNGKAGITFKLPISSSNYSHYGSNPTNINGISWVGSLIRSNCVASGEDIYTYDPAVTSSTSGNYYTLNGDGTTFNAVTLPGAFVSGTKYYTKTTAASDGVFYAGLPSDLKMHVKRVSKKTWTGYGTANGSNDNTVVYTNDPVFILADCEVFGEDNRSASYSKFAIEGNRYELFKKYAENIFRTTNNWLRSPYSTSGTNFANWYSFGCVNNYSASTTNRVSPCFCV